MMDIALTLSGMEKCHADSGVEIPGENVRKVLAGIDITGAEVMAAKYLGYDCVATHHPHSTRMASVGDAMQNDHFEMMVRFGVPINVAQKVAAELSKSVSRNNHGTNMAAVAQLARLMGLSMICIHTHADVIVEKAMRKRMDELSASNPRVTLKDIIDNLMEVREYKESPQPPAIWIGDEKSYAGKIMVTMSGVGAPRLEEYRAVIDAGVGTIIGMHMKPEIFDALKKDNKVNVIMAGHMSSDSYGFNRILEKWEEKGVEVTRVGGIV
jgi:putative NIF3 family GTP cyclohydrolase 1 type 2